MNRLSRYLWLLAGCLFFVACKETQKTGNIPTFDLQKDYPEQDVFIQDIADVTYIPLETTDESVLGVIGGVICLNDTLVISDSQQNKVFFFDRQGKYLSSFGHVGGGKTEYFFLHKLCVDPDRREILVYDNPTKSRIVVYDFAGNFIRELKLSEKISADGIYDYDKDYLLAYDVYMLEIPGEGAPNPYPYCLISKTTGEVTRLPLKVERGNRVFPASDKASDVTRCLEALCRRAGAEICFQEEVRSLQKQGEGFLVQTSARALEADAVVVCTGGVSYPATGSTGDGYAFARRFGLSVTPPKAALCGIACAFRPEDDLQGLSLKNVRLSALEGGKAVQSFFGELLFAHFGISGPVTLSLSSFVNERDLSRVALEIDLKPALDDETLDRRIMRDLAQEKNKQLGTVLRLLLPQRLIASVLARAGVAAATPAHSLTKEGRRKLVHALKHFSLRPTALRPVEEAIVTAGGVDVRELDPKTMQSKKVAGLYFAGEVIDADALTGGYNLQTGFTTGYIAGKSASF